MWWGHLEESALLTGAGVLPLWLKALAALSGDPSLVPNIHAGWLMTTYNASSKGSGTVFWPPEGGDMQKLHCWSS